MRSLPLILVSAGASSAAWAEPLARGSAPEIPWLRLLLAFTLCIAIAGGAVLCMKHYQRRGGGGLFKGLLPNGQGRAKRRIAVLETRRASIHADLCLVECDGETFFLALTPAGANILDRRGAKERPA